MMYVTKDYLYHTNPLTKETQVYRIHHEFKLKIENKKTNKYQAVAWFHLFLSIFIEKDDPFYFNIYLKEKLATEEEKTRFPVISVFAINHKLSLLSVAPLTS